MPYSDHLRRSQPQLGIAISVPAASLVVIGHEEMDKARPKGGAVAPRFSIDRLVGVISRVVLGAGRLVTNQCLFELTREGLWDLVVRRAVGELILRPDGDRTAGGGDCQSLPVLPIRRLVFPTLFLQCHQLGLLSLSGLVWQSPACRQFSAARTLSGWKYQFWT